MLAKILGNIKRCFKTKVPSKQVTVNVAYFLSFWFCFLFVCLCFYFGYANIKVIEALKDFFKIGNSLTGSGKSLGTEV